MSVATCTNPGFITKNLSILLVFLFSLSGCGESSTDSSPSGGDNSDPVSEGVVIEIGDDWRYQKGLSAPPSDWNTTSFDDANWLVGKTGIGYGDDDDAEILLDMRDNYTTVYTRKLVNYDGSFDITSMNLEIAYDDGFVAYLNGQEIARANMPAGQPAFDTLATASIDAGAPLFINLDGFRNLMNVGDNVLAIEVHNADISSSDLSFLPRLTVNLGESQLPVVTITGGNGAYVVGDTVTLTGTATDAEDGTITGNLAWSSSLDGSIPGSGGSVSTNALSLGTHTITATVTDSDGNSDSDTTSVTISAIPLPQSPVVTITSGGGTYDLGDTVTLTGTATDAEDGTITVNLAWSSSIDGSITGSGGSVSTNALSLGTHTITATVTDSDGSSDTDTTSVTVNAQGNNAPVANAGIDKNATTGTLVTLNGNGSSDADSDPLTYAWTLTSQPNGSSASLSSSTSVAPTFTADLDGTYEISLVVNDGTVNSQTDVVVITSITSSFDCASNQVHCVDDTAGVDQEYSTIQTAVDISQPGDTVLVFDGNYSGFRVSSSGTSSQRITVVANSSNANITSTEPFGSNAIRVQNASYVTIDGFRIDGSGFGSSSNYDNACIAARGASAGSPMQDLIFRNNNLTACNPAGMYLSNIRDLSLTRNVIKNTRANGNSQGQGVYLANASVDNAVITENVIADNGGHAMHLNGDSSVGGDGVQTGHIIKFNFFEGNGLNALNMDGVQDLLVENNVFSGNTKHGVRGFRIDGSGGPRNITIVNNTFYDNESPVKTSEDDAGHVIFNNLIVDNQDNNIVITTGNYSASNNTFSINETSFFTNAANNDLRLISGSSAINSGISDFVGVNAPGDDLSSNPRSGNPDLGAFEFGSNYPAWYE